MQLEELAQRYKIFVDLDGGVVDFDAEMERIGFKRAEVEGNSKAKGRFWHEVGRKAHRGEPFWGVMKPMADADVLWSYVKRYNPEILSATGHVGNATEEKHAWVKQHLGEVPTHLVRKSSDKAQFAAPTHILIDDRAKSIEPWVAAGGIGILHTSAADTIRQLKELGI
jgi:5'(3')-deoxyribonucleotidase